MALVINNNMMAANAARNLGSSYNRLSTSTQRLSSGLRINSAADDAAGLAIREMMRADIAATRQGLRNAADAISMIQTADGALGVIDEKLIRMKELAEQAATGTYTTVQRDIINSEYQAMAAEIDRIASATNFNGIKLLDGSVNQQHGGQGLKVHFGVGNDAAEDYYFVSIGDARATSGTGLRVGGDAKNDIWASGGAAGMLGAEGGCCASGFESLTSTKELRSGQAFSYAYNWDGQRPGDMNAFDGRYTAGLYVAGSGESLQSLVNSVNAGTQSRVGIELNNLNGATLTNIASGFSVCIGDEAYYVGNTNNELDATSFSASFTGTAADLAAKINASSQSFWAAVDGTNGNMVYVFSRKGGDNNHLEACEQILGAQGTSAQLRDLANTVNFQNMSTMEQTSAGASFSLGGEHWGTMKGVQSKDINGKQVWNAVIEGRDVGKGRDIQIAQPTSNNNELDTYGTGSMRVPGLPNFSAAKFLNRNAFTQVQDAADAEWAGAEVRTQSSAQEALEALDAAIVKKDKIRADLGAMQNRLENTMTNLEIQAENLQSSESRISDVDVALEMTEFTRNNILAQAATGMLGQANSMSQLALRLLG